MGQQFSLTNKGQVISTSVTSAFTPFTAGTQAQLAASNGNIMICNPSAIGVHVLTGETSVTADSSCVYVPPATTRIFSKPLSHTGIAIIAVSGTPAITVIHGSGC